MTTPLLKICFVDSAFDPAVNGVANTLYFKHVSGDEVQVIFINGDKTVIGKTITIAEIEQVTALAAKVALDASQFEYSSITNPPTSYPPSPHSHTASNVTNIATAITGTKRQFTSQQAYGSPITDTQYAQGDYTLPNADHPVCFLEATGPLNINASQSVTSRSPYILVLKTNNYDCRLQSSVLSSNISEQPFMVSQGTWVFEFMFISAASGRFRLNSGFQVNY